MMFGELKEKSDDYRAGHSKGSDRAYSDAISHFMMLAGENKRKKFTCKEIVFILENCRINWTDYCDTHGMGVIPEDDL